MKELTKKIESIPNLLELSKFDYEAQDLLAAAYRNNGKAFLYAMPERHLDRCKSCGYEEGAVSFSLEVPIVSNNLISNALSKILYSGLKGQSRNRILKFSYSKIDFHNWSVHGVKPPKEIFEELHYVKSP